MVFWCSQHNRKFLISCICNRHGKILIHTRTMYQILKFLLNSVQMTITITLRNTSALLVLVIRHTHNIYLTGNVGAKQYTFLYLYSWAASSLPYWLRDSFLVSIKWTIILDLEWNLYRMKYLSIYSIKYIRMKYLYLMKYIL